MWKYHCKTHFCLVGVAFLLGVALMAFTFDASLEVYTEFFNQEFVDFLVSNPVLTYIMGGMSFAGIANACLLLQYIMRKFAFGPFILLALLVLAPDAILSVGAIMVIPSLIVSLIGWILLHRETARNLKEAGYADDKAMFDAYISKYSLDESVKDMAEMCRKNTMKMSGIYALGIVAVITVMAFVNNLIVLVVAFFFYSFAFNLLMRYRASCTIPITALLYNECDPQKCISGIYYFSNYKRRFKIANYTLFAQCLIYLNEPELAKAVLIPYQKKDAASMLSYLSVMAYIDYMLKDDDALNAVSNSASKLRLNYGRTGVYIQSEEMAAIQNKIQLMNGELHTCKKYYLQALQKAKFPFQQVDACYYIAMISFVEEDYVIAEMYFNKVISMGNKMAFVEKANHYLSKIKELNIQEAE